MKNLDFTARAELYLGSSRTAASAQGARSFPTAAQAIRFALEEAAPVSLHGAMLKIGTRRFSSGEIKKLYDSRDYPLLRRNDAGRVAA